RRGRHRTAGRLVRGHGRGLPPPRRPRPAGRPRRLTTQPDAAHAGGQRGAPGPGAGGPAHQGPRPHPPPARRGAAPPPPVLPPGLAERPAGDEVGVVTAEGGAELPRLAARREFIVPHADPTTNLHDRIYAMREDRVEAVWPLAARREGRT